MLEQIGEFISTAINSLSSALPVYTESQYTSDCIVSGVEATKLHELLRSKKLADSCVPIPVRA